MRLRFSAQKPARGRTPTAPCTQGRIAPAGPAARVSALLPPGSDVSHEPYMMACTRNAIMSRTRDHVAHTRSCRARGSSVASASVAKGAGHTVVHVRVRNRFTAMGGFINLQREQCSAQAGPKRAERSLARA